MAESSSSVSFNDNETKRRGNAVFRSDIRKEDKVLPNDGDTTLQTLKAKVEQESTEFAFLKPICAQVLQNPSNQNLRIFEDALSTVGNVPAHLSEFVTFPFAIHLKVIRNYKESQRVDVFRSFAKLLHKAELRNSYDMFVNIFQKLNVALCTSNNLTTVNIRMAENEMESILDCIANLTLVSLSFHIDSLCQPEKVQIIGHAIFLLLQIVVPEVSKNSRLKALSILGYVINLCEGLENRSKVLSKFLPGIISTLRKICLPSVGQSTKEIIKNSLDVMGNSINICTEFESTCELENADGMLSQIIELLSKEFVLHPDVEYRLSFLKFCGRIAPRSQLPKCCKTVTCILLRMREDSDISVCKVCVEVLENVGVVTDISFEDLSNLIASALNDLTSGDDVACILNIREVSSVLSTRKLSFIEFQSFLPLVFKFMNELIWKFRSSITIDCRAKSDPLLISSSKVCQNLLDAVDVNEVIFEFTSVLSDLQTNSNVITYPTGVIVTFNEVLTNLINSKRSSLSAFEAANLAEVYLSLIDMQSSEVVLNSITSDIPAVHTASEIRKAYLLEGLGILGSAYPTYVIPIVLYTLVEYAGSQNSEGVNASAELALKRISASTSLEVFLKEHLEFILTEISVRMLNIILYPNCPNALIFLAQYFDFSEDSFSGFIDQAFERCSDEFSGGNLQHIYVRVFYAFIKSMDKYFSKDRSFTANRNPEVKKSLLEKLLDYQLAVGVKHPSVKENVEFDDCINSNGKEEELTEENLDDDKNESTEKLDPVLQLALRISNRVLNYLPNQDRFVRLKAMDCLILGVNLLKHQENALLPLSHTIWQNLVPRFDEQDYVVVRKTFELLLALCTSCGSFLTKRTIEEAFPKLSTLLLRLAKEGELVKNKNRQYYTYTQAYKLQLTVLEGMGDLLKAMDVQEFELDNIVSGCIMYIKPNQHKNLQNSAMKLLEKVSSGKNARTIRLKLIVHGLKSVPEIPPNPEFKCIPKEIFNINTQPFSLL